MTDGACDVRAYFFLSGFDCDPTEASRPLGLVPSRVQLKGTPKQLTPGVYEFNALEVESVGARGVELETCLRALASLLPADLSALNGVGGDLFASVRCVVKVPRDAGAFPPLVIAPEVVRRLAALGADVDIDLYWMP